MLEQIHQSRINDFDKGDIQVFKPRGICPGSTEFLQKVLAIFVDDLIDDVEEVISLSFVKSIEVHACQGNVAKVSRVLSTSLVRREEDLSSGHT